VAGSGVAEWPPVTGALGGPLAGCTPYALVLLATLELSVAVATPGLTGRSTTKLLSALKDSVY